MSYKPSAKNMACKTPTFMPHEQFLLGMGVVFNILKYTPFGKKKLNCSFGTSWLGAILQVLEEDKRATTNVQNCLVFFFLCL